MGFIKSEAIVLRTKNLREADKLITLYTRNYGKVQAVAKGLRKVKSRYGASLEIFSHNQVMLYTKTNKDIATITGCKLIRPFYSLRESYFKYSMASYLLELVDKLSDYREINEEIFRLLDKSFSIMEASILKTRENYLSLWNWFVLKILDYSGYKMSLSSCVVCRKQVSLGQSVTISLSEGGVVCRECPGAQDFLYELDGKVFEQLIKLQKTGLVQLVELQINIEDRLTIKGLLEKYLQFISGDTFKCQKFFFTNAERKT